MIEHHKLCMVCNKLYIAKRSDGMYCGGACKEKAFLKRRGLKPLSRAELLVENRLMKSMLELHLKSEAWVISRLPLELKDIIIAINNEARKFL